MNYFQTIKGFVYVVTTLVIWAFFAIFSRMVETQQLNAWDVNFLRFSFASLMIVLFLLWKRQWIHFPIRPMLALSLLGGIGYCVIVYTGFLYAPVSHSAIWLNTCIPVSTFVLSVLLIGRDFSKDDLRVFCIIVASILLMITYGLWTQSYVFSIGDLLFFIGSLFWAGYTLLLKKWQISISQAVIGVTLTSFVMYTPIYWLFLPKNIHNEAWEIMLMQGVFHGVFMVIVASFTFIKSIELLGAFKAGSILALAPFLAVILAIPLLNEWPETASLIGLAGLMIAITKPWTWKINPFLANRD